MTSTKTIAVSEPVWQRLKDLMKKEHARSLNQVVAKLLEDASGVQPSRFGVHRRLKLRLTQREHEDITRDAH